MCKTSQHAPTEAPTSGAGDSSAAPHAAGASPTCWPAQVLHPQIVTLATMVLAVVMTVAPHWSGGVVIWLSLASQAVLGLTNATICGGIMSMASWLPSPYVQVSTAPRHAHVGRPLLESRTAAWKSREAQVCPCIMAGPGKFH